MKATFKNERGIALIVVVVVMALLLSITGAGLLFSSINLKRTSSFKDGIRALYVADAGIQHALTVVSTGTTFNFSTSTDVASGSFGTNFTYTVAISIRALAVPCVQIRRISLARRLAWLL